MSNCRVRGFRLPGTLLVVLWLAPFSLIPPNAHAQDLKAADPTAPITTKADGVNLRYARKRLELAKMDLDIAVARNQRTPQAYSQFSLLRLQNQVSQAEVLLENALLTEQPNPHRAHKKCLQLSVELAQSQLDWVSEYSKKIPGMFPSDEVKRFSMNLELAQLARERANDATIDNSPMHHLQWQIDQLQTDVLLLQLELERTKSGK